MDASDEDSVLKHRVLEMDGGENVWEEEVSASSNRDQSGYVNEAEQRAESSAARNSSNGFDSDLEDVAHFDDFGSVRSIYPLRRMRSSQEALISQHASGSGSDMDVITGWLYNGPLQRAKYEDFSTIDWIYDNTKARHYKSDLRARARAKGWVGRIELLADSCKSWVVLLAVGMTMGLLATCISVSAQWLIDIKNGHCRTGFYLNRRFCCLHGDTVCVDWVTWSEHLHVRWRWLAWLLQYSVHMFAGILFAGISTYLVTEYAPYAAGQGIAEIKTIMSGFMMRRFLGLRTLGIKCVGVVLAVASGLSLGKEGTMVHVACCCSNVYARAFGRIRGSEVKRRELLSAASAAGISVAFGSPIAGVLFSLEQVSYYFPAKTMWRSLFCATVAAMTLKLLNPFRNGKLVSFQVTYDRTWDLFELWFFVAIGVVCGVIGMAQNRLALLLMRYRQRSALKNLPRGEAVVVALVTAAICYPSVFLRADAVTLVSNLFTECAAQDDAGLCSRADRASNVVALTLTSALRVPLTCLAVGLAVPAGMFLPSMATGASLGRAFGMVVQTLYEQHPTWRIFAACKPDVPCITPGVYALVGAAAMLSSTTRMTVTVVVMMFELSDALIYVLPIMLAVTVSKAVADAFGTDGYFEAIIRLNGYPFLSVESEEVFHGTSDELMTRASQMAVVSATEETLGSVRDLLASTYSGFPVVKSRSSMVVTGYIARSDLLMVTERAQQSSVYSDASPCCFARTLDASLADRAPLVDFRPWVDHAPVTIGHGTDINVVADVFRELGVRYVLVTHQGMLLGIITKKDIVRAVRLQERAGAGRSAVDGLVAWLRTWRRGVGVLAG